MELTTRALVDCMPRSALTSLIDKHSRVLVANRPLGVIIMMLGGACG